MTTDELLGELAARAVSIDQGIWALVAVMGWIAGGVWADFILRTAFRGVRLIEQIWRQRNAEYLAAHVRAGRIAPDIGLAVAERGCPAPIEDTPVRSRR